MTIVVGLLAALGILLWPHNLGLRGLVILPGMASASRGASASTSAIAPRAGTASAWERASRWRPGPGPAAINAQDLLSLLEAIAPALEAGMAPAAALRIAADARSGSGRPDPLTSIARDMATAATDGAMLGPLWRGAAESAASPELLLLAQAWSLTEDMGAPLAQAVRTTAGLLEARIAHERRLAAAVAGARATVNVLTVLPIGGPLMALVLGIGPAELYGGSRLTQGSLVLGLGLALVGRLWVRRMVRSVARGPVIA